MHVASVHLTSSYLLFKWNDRMVVQTYERLYHLLLALTAQWTVAFTSLFIKAFGITFYPNPGKRNDVGYRMAAYSR